MAFGVSPFGTAAFGASEAPAVVFDYDMASLGYVVTLGGPYVGRHDSLHAMPSLGHVATFGTGFAGAIVFPMRSLGYVARFGNWSTPGDTTHAMGSAGYVVRLGNMAAVPFVGYATGPYSPPGGIDFVGYQSGPYVRPSGITFIERASS